MIAIFPLPGWKDLRFLVAARDGGEIKEHFPGSNWFTLEHLTSRETPNDGISAANAECG
jgi:hypothetical protein